MVAEKRNKFVFKAIAVAMPFVFLVLLELLLGVINYGYNSKLFIEDKKQKGFYYSNPEISKLFFSNSRDSRLGNTFYFKKEKSPETFRVFVLGGSSAYGYPYTSRASFPRMLDYRLSKTFRDRNIEVVNLAITAVNSWTFLSFVDEIIEMNPDAVLIYAGHNEYYGAMGVGSSHRFGNKRGITKMVVSLKKFKVVQFVFNVTGSIQKAIQGKVKQDEGFMHRMAKEQEIDYGSKLFKQGITQFEENMGELLSSFEQDHIPVYLSNVVSNEKDQKPFVSALSGKEDSVMFFKEYRIGLQAFENGNYDISLKSLLNANKIDSSYANSHYVIGSIKYLEHDYKNAEQYFSNASQLDALRFRAPHEINRRIFLFKNEFDNIYLVDTKRKFEEHSLGGITDNRLFVDHLHPNMYGYFLIAEAFYESILESGLLNNDYYQAISSSTAWSELPITKIDSIYGEWMSKVMKKQWPFYEDVVFDPDSTESYPELLTNMIFNNIISTDMAMDSLFLYYSKENNIPEALKVVESLCLDHRYDWRYPAETANLYQQMDDFNESAFYYKKAFALYPSVEMAQKSVFALVQSDQPQAAIYYLEFILSKKPNDQLATRLLRKISEVLVNKKLFQEDSENIDAVIGLAEYYLFVRKIEEAKKYLDLAQTISPGNDRSEILTGIYEKLSDENQQ